MSIVKTTDLTAEAVRMKFNYNQHTGLLTYSGRERAHLSPSARSRRTDRVAGYPDSHGYLNVSIGKRSYLVHRIIWLYVNGEWPTQILDHVNGIPTDNRIENLRLVSQSTNTTNRYKSSSKSSSGILGVSPGITSGTWLANISANGKPMRLGTFSSQEEAYATYLNAKTLVHPESGITSGMIVDLSKFNKTAERNIRNAGFWPT